MAIRLRFSFDVVWTLILVLYSVPAGAEDFCQLYTFEPKCADDQVIEIKTAAYGRMKLGKCIENNFGYLGCQKDVLSIAERKCSGRQTCVISVPDSDMEASKPCPSDLKNYLSITYSCIKVYTPVSHNCDIVARVDEPSHNNGYIAASTATSSNGCGTSGKPWIFRIAKGQSLNITLHDFAHRSGSRTDNVSLWPSNTEQCNAYATLKEKGNTTIICGGLQRERVVYFSRGNDVEVRMHTGSKNRERHFVLEYHISGCANPEVPDGAWISVEGKTATLGCSSAEQTTWKMECRHNRWHGDTEIHSCEHAAVLLEKSVQKPTLNMPATLSIVIVLSVAFLLGCIILTTGVCVLKRRRVNRRNELAREYNVPRQALYKDTSALPEAMRHQALPIPAIPDYHGNPPPYYAARKTGNTSPEHDYEYVADLITQTAAPTANRSQADLRQESSQESTRPHNVTAYGSVDTPAGTSNSVLVAIKPKAHKTINEYVSEEKPVQPPKYFEVDPRNSQHGGISKDKNRPSVHSYPPHNNSRHNFGHYSQ